MDACEPESNAASSLRMSHEQTPPVEGSGCFFTVCMWVFYQGRGVENKSPASLFVTFIRVTICLYLMPESLDSLRHSSSPVPLSHSWIKFFFSPYHIIKQPLGKTLDRHPVASRNIKRRQGTSGEHESVALASQQLTRSRRSQSSGTMHIRASDCRDAWHKKPACLHVLHFPSAPVPY